jgi:hypothetical protein
MRTNKIDNVSIIQIVIKNTALCVLFDTLQDKEGYN